MARIHGRGRREGCSIHIHRIRVRDAAKRFLPLTESTYWILLSLTQPMHGYGIMQNVRSMTDGAVELGPGTVYGALSNLLEQRLITTAGQCDTDNGKRKHYVLTDLGRRVLELEHERLSALVRVGGQLISRVRDDE